jgi:hypothetical protein
VRREWNEEDRGKGKVPLGPAAMKIISRACKGKKKFGYYLKAMSQTIRGV